MYRESNCSWCGTIGFGLRILNLDRFAERYEQNARILAHRYLRRQQERRDLVEEEAWERALLEAIGHIEAWAGEETFSLSDVQLPAEQPAQ